MKIPVLNGSPKRDKRGITKEAITAILLAICLLLSGCGGKTTFDGSKTSDETGFRMEYSILDKEESAELELTEGDQIQVYISRVMTITTKRK